MELINETPLQAGWTVGFRKDGREVLVVAIKGTWSLDGQSEDPPLADEQQPLVESDTFTGEPGLSATVYESDYAHHKPSCDVLLNGSAYAPGGRAARRVTVGLLIGPIKKRFDVVGARRWRRGLFRSRPSWPSRFARQAISYDCAYGGADRSERDPEKVRTFLANPVGVGYYPLKRGGGLVALPLPNTEEHRRSATKRRGSYRPMAFGPIGRNFAGRVEHAGTYDAKWLDRRAPFFPDDFDDRYFQCAPEDQRMPYPQGGEPVLLENLSPEGRLRFRLPTLPMPVLFLGQRSETTEQRAQVDTIVIEPDEKRLMMVWRTQLPLRRNCFEVRHIVVGRSPAAHRRVLSRDTKKQFAALDEFVRAARARRTR